MNNSVFVKAKLPFQAGQIIHLEYQNTRLYGHTIQIVVQRGLCWFRPVLMAIEIADREQYFTEAKIIDLRSSSDLLWPIDLFELSLDTEVIPLLAKLGERVNSLDKSLVSCPELHQFIHQVWQANQDKF